MSDVADTQAQPDGQGSASAAGAGEPTIPKHRFDQVLQQLREARESNEMKDRILSQFGAARHPGQQPQDLKPEDFGMEPETFKAVSTLARKIAGDMVAERERVLRPLIGQVANTAQEAAFLGKYGQDKARYLDDIRAVQEEHQRMTGGYLPIERAFQLAHYRELVAKEQARARGGQAPAAASTATGNQAPDPATDPVLAGGGYPSGDLTRSAPRSTGAAAPAAGGAGQAKSFGEMSVEEMEALLDGSFAKGASI